MSEVVKQDFVFEWDGKVGYIKPEVHFDCIYDRAYWDKYVKYEKTDLGCKLDYHRVKFLCENIDRNISDYSILDIGIGSGSFLKWLNRNENVMKLFGYDVNKIAKEWLINHRMFLNKESEIDIMTFWDSLEHIPNPTDFITTYNPKYVFMSLPIFRNCKHIINSKYFRPHEHIWYFTEDGLWDMFENIGYEIYSRNKFEIELGREDIYSYCFIRKEKRKMTAKSYKVGDTTAEKIEEVETTPATFCTEKPDTTCKHTATEILSDKGNLINCLEDKEYKSPEHAFPTNKYHRIIHDVHFPDQKCLVDVYEVIEAFNVTCPARQHAIKKILCAGLRGKGDTLQDLKEAKQAIQRAIEMETNRNKEK